MDTVTLEHNETPIAVVHADSEPLTRYGLRRLLSDKYAVRGEGDTLDSVVGAFRLTTIGLLVLEPKDSSSDWVDQLSILMAETPDLNVLLLTRDIGNEDIVAAFDAGARGVILKTATQEEVLQAIETVNQGNFWFPGVGSVRTLAKHLTTLRDQVKKGSVRSARYGITPREFDLIEGLLDGCSNSDMAVKMGISEETIKRHMSNAFDKTGVSTRLELALFAINHGLTKRYQPVAA